MIYTITLNPAIDYTIETNGFSLNETNYYDNAYSLIGGKGINVAFVLNNLKNNVLATGFLGDENFEKFNKKFKELKLKNNFFLYPGNTRTNFKIKDLSNNLEVELNGYGQKIDKNYVNKLMNYLKNNLTKNDIVVVSGSIPKNLDSKIYQELGQVINQKQALFILDSSKSALLNGLKSKPYLIKPNIGELCAIFEKQVKDYDFIEIQKMILKLRRLGARNILLSMGSNGSYFFSEDNSIYKIGIGKGKLINSVGAGDSMLAGFVHGIENNLSLIETLKYASACGSATAFNKW
ncbi:1-phosphofructokinase, partial [Mycoplasma putrefaciens]